MEATVDLQPEVSRGLSLFRPPPELRLSEWAAANFYLSAESSYVEQRWSAYPYQVGIMDCMGNDAVEEVVLRKSARVGYTKMLLAALAYFAEHKGRNQAVWQPTDDDSDEFVKTELEPMIRDVPAMLEIFPGFGMRSKDNTLRQKKFRGCVLHMRGGKAAKNYRRLSLSVAAIDEADAFDSDVEGEGSPVSLARKRLEGATFPKLIVGSTPKTKGYSLVDGREAVAEKRMRFKVPCPCCGERIELRWGGKDEAYGFKWTGDPDTVRHLCEKCGGLFDQSDYLGVWERGRWEADDGTYIDELGAFCLDGEPVSAPRSVSFFVWTAYSPQTTWAQLVREFLSAKAKAKKGDVSELKAFINTTLGESWEEGGEAVVADALQKRAEDYDLGTLPAGVIRCTMSVDTQGDRLEYLIKGWGALGESWQVDFDVIRGNPAEPAVWAELRSVILRKLERSDGVEMRVSAVAIDSGGLHTHHVYQFCRANKDIVGKGNVFAVKGHSQRGRPIIGRPSIVDVNLKGETIKRGTSVYLIGTDTAKNLIYDMLRLPQPGPGYVHFSKDLPDEYYEQLTSEKRITKHQKGQVYHVWTLPSGVRNEALDLEVYAIAAAQKIGLHKWRPRKWEYEAKRLAPPKAPVAIPEEHVAIVAERPVQKPVAQRRPGGFVKGWRR